MLWLGLGTKPTPLGLEKHHIQMMPLLCFCPLPLKQRQYEEALERYYGTKHSQPRDLI